MQIGFFSGFSYRNCAVFCGRNLSLIRTDSGVEFHSAGKVRKDIERDVDAYLDRGILPDIGENKTVKAA